MKTFLVSLAFLGLASWTGATCPVRQRVVVHRPVVVQRAAVVQQAVAVQAVNTVAVATFVPVAVAVPTYGVGYSAPQADGLAALGAEVRALRQELAALRQPVPPGGGQAPAQAASGKAPAVLGTKCATCHEAGVSRTKGGNFTLAAAGALAPLTERQLRRIATRVYTGSMPPKDNKEGVQPCTDEEVASIMQWLESLK